MKKAKDSKPISTIPEGVYECGIIKETTLNGKKHEKDITTDAQGNGYPVHNKSEQ